MTNAVVNKQVTLPCSAPPGTTAVWCYQQFCENFDCGMYPCSYPTEVAIGNQYQIRTNAIGANSLLINDVTKNTTGLYVCKNPETGEIHYRGLLNIISK